VGIYEKVVDMIMQKLARCVNKIEQLSLKRKIIIFCGLFILSGVWVTVRNPVYQETTAYVFPVADTGDGRIYYGIKNGYNKLLSFEIPQDGYYNHISAIDVDSIWVDSSEDTDKSELQIIDIANGIHMYQLNGENITLFPTGEQCALPRKGIRLLVVKNGSSVELYFSSLEFFYQKQLLNRNVAATFPFYLAYTGGAVVAFDKSILDTDLYDVSYERRQSFADNYLDPTIPHYIAKNFKRAISFPFGYFNGRFSKKLILFSFLGALALALFFFFVPFRLIKVFLCDQTNKSLFIILGVYFVVLFLIFRHSVYHEWQGATNTVIALEYGAFFSHAYMVSEYVFYLIGISSRVFCQLFLLCLLIWNYDKILGQFLVSPFQKALKYLLVALPLITPIIISMAIRSAREYVMPLLVILGHMFLIRSKLLKEKRYFAISAITFLIVIALRMDTVILFLPILIFMWLERISLRNTFRVCLIGIALMVYTLIVGQGSNFELRRLLISDAYMVDKIIIKHKNELSKSEKQIIADIYDGGIDALENTFVLYYALDHKITQPLTEEKVKAFRELSFSLISRYPKEFIDHIVSKYKSFTTDRSYLWMTPYVTYIPMMTGPANVASELPYKHNLYKSAIDLLKQESKPLYQSFSIIVFILMCILFIFRLRTIGVIGIGFFLYFIFVLVYSPQWDGSYFQLYACWFYFMFGIFIIETMQNGLIRRSHVLPFNVIIILLLFMLRHDFTNEYQPPVWNETFSSFEQSSTINYPYYYRIVDKKVMLSAVNTINSPIKYSLELETKGGQIDVKQGTITPINRQVFEVLTIPSSASKVKFTFFTPDLTWLNGFIQQYIEMRRHIYTVLIFLLMYINISYMKLFGKNNCLLKYLLKMKLKGKVVFFIKKGKSNLL
jgi:hypothetical protein